ncbi:histidine kinase N-terminal 7TM domain-containing protein [Methanolobus vulcani]|uniref:PAS domain-containing protein n=1 Tax=Methanolobus vulcani TaxID=38026 RepID=A0A7Z8P262_9EURY|nr:histidine kinase N-terminal 7TM domain-containing protein [Methanolobus vulcani]TQD25260.1 PAS domain-containing protein [Methanolobus vulcani]
MYLNYYALPLLALAFILCMMLYHIKKHKDADGTTSFSLLLVCSIIYSFFYALEISSADFNTALIFYKLQYMGIPFIPYFFLIFAIKYSGKKRWLNATTLIALTIIPLLTIALVFTIGEHTLYFKEIAMRHNGIFPALTCEPGIWYSVQQAYNFFCLITGQVLLLKMWFEVAPAFRKQVSVVIIGAIVPFVVLIVYDLGGFTPGLDLLPYSLTFTSLLIYIGLTRYKLLDITPLARSALFEKLPDGVIVIDGTKRIGDCNSSAMKYLDIHPQDIGKNAADVLSSWPEIIGYEQNNDGNKVTSIEIVRKIQNSDMWFNVDFLPLTSVNENTLGWMIIIRDITKSKIAEKELHETNRNLKEANENAEYMAARAEIANRAKTEFLANMSHEIRTPLNLIIGFSDILMEMELDKSQLHYVETVHKSGNMLLELINDVLDYSRIESGKMAIVPEMINLAHFVDQIAKSFISRASEKGVAFSVGLSENFPHFVIVDSARLSQVLENLLDNAIKFTEKGEINLWIKTTVIPDKTEEMMFTFSVNDTGIGIPEKDKSRIFESFSQVDGSTTRKYGGTGLGLAISSKILELMDSKLELRSEHDGGSTFFFTLVLPFEK